MRQRLTTLAELTGIALLAIGAGIHDVGAGVAVLGVGLIAVGVAEGGK